MGLATYAMHAAKILARRRLSRADMKSAADTGDTSKRVSHTHVFAKDVSMTVDGPRVRIDRYDNARVIASEIYDYNTEGLLFRCEIGGVEYRPSGRLWKMKLIGF